ncbi:hypothetical protein [Actinomadura sp. DC4]|uniref:hypothetical protein n=1 Tax=Actinomadura sp. DC4 TaxID=3055069 RepID=UPI0025B05C8D|nr:hypothetical protein [Actinomadura sp. DC4]MDN3359412.1 hypothetical protein [Actinomadura sp. DC4]
MWCATSPRLDGLGGRYRENSDVAPLAHDQAPRRTAPGTRSFGVVPYALDPASAVRLWDRGVRLTA